MPDFEESDCSSHGSKEVGSHGSNNGGGLRGGGRSGRGGGRGRRAVGGGRGSARPGSPPLPLAPDPLLDGVDGIASTIGALGSSIIREHLSRPGSRCGTPARRDNLDDGGLGVMGTSIIRNPSFLRPGSRGGQHRGYS